MPTRCWDDGHQRKWPAVEQATEKGQKMIESNAYFAIDHDEPVDVSVLVGRVSTEDSDRVLETIAAFAEGAEGLRYEIVIVDRLNDELSVSLARDYPTVLHIPCASSLSLPEMRTIAFEASQGAIVAVTEDHCVPAPSWLRIVRDAFRNGEPATVALGGSVINGVTDTGFDWATFLCEYSFFSPPVVEGPTRVLPGMNIAYRRDVLESVPRSVLTSGFWETTLHTKLIEAGGVLRSLNALQMYHCKRFSSSLFFRQRFIYSQYYAGLRFSSAGGVKRLIAALTSLALPPILLWRMQRSARSKGLSKEFVAALPALSILVVIWALGESIGALVGPRNALARIE